MGFNYGFSEDGNFDMNIPTVHHPVQSGRRQLTDGHDASSLLQAKNTFIWVRKTKARAPRLA